MSMPPGQDFQALYKSSSSKFIKKFAAIYSLNESKSDYSTLFEALDNLKPIIW